MEWPTHWWPQRFGDIHLTYRPNAVVWHTLARLTGDGEFLALAHDIAPQPHTAFDFLMWEPLSEKWREVGASDKAPRHFPVSGMAFMGDDRLSVAVRAGEFWNHNHLDAGSFIHCQNGVVWVDDCGTCKYSSPDYTGYYTSPQAHNVAFSPELAPPNGQTQYLGQDLSGRILSHESVKGLETVHVDTRVLSGGRLARSQRRLFMLGGEVMVIWDDLEAYEERSFEFLLHTTCHVTVPVDGAFGVGALEAKTGERCALSFFSDASSSFDLSPAEMGEISKHDPFLHGEPEGVLEGTCLRWRGSEKTVRRKFGLAMGTGLRSAEWKEVESGWECVLETETTKWSLWFNAMADGRVSHVNTLGNWRGFETDAYGLILRENMGKASLAGIDASFVRQGATVVRSSLTRQGLTFAPI